jgi:hypothetical protein
MLEIPKNFIPFSADPKLSEKAIYLDRNLPQLMDLHQKTIHLSIHANEMEVTFRIIPFKTGEAENYHSGSFISGIDWQINPIRKYWSISPEPGVACGIACHCFGIDKL